MSDESDVEASRAITVLLVDDEPCIVEEMAEALEEAGFTVRGAFDYGSAVDWMRRDETIEVVVTDLKMPGKDGLELVHATLDEFPGRFNYLVISGHLSGDIAAEDVTVLAKPFDLHELVATVRAVVRA